MRHLVELHGGSVRAESEGMDKGATFTIRLPLRLERQEIEEEETVPRSARGRQRFLTPDEAPRLAGIRILVVDDEPDTRELLRQVLEGCGAEVREADSVALALQEVREWQPGVIVSDIGLPGEDGYELIRKVRDWERNSGTWTPAVALTAYARTKDRMRALVAGYQVHVAKPIEPLEFALVVAGLVHSPSPLTEAHSSSSEPEPTS